MGCGESAAERSDQEDVIEVMGSEPTIKERNAPLSGLPDNVTKQDFQNARMKLSMDQALKELNSLAKDLSKKPVIPKSMKKACFLCCNTYTKPAYRLGVGPLNDTITVALNHKKLGYECYFLHNPTPDQFMQFLQKFIAQTTGNLTVFFTGHGANVKDKNGDESDGMDEAMVFDTGHIVDDKLVQLISKANGRTKIVLLTDCCHSGSIWDLQSANDHGLKLPKNIVSLSAAKDSQTAKQTKMKQKDQGIFTYYFWKIFNENPNCTVKTMEPKINAGISRFKQHFTIASTSPNMLSEPLFK